MAIIKPTDGLDSAANGVQLGALLLVSGYISANAKAPGWYRIATLSGASVQIPGQPVGTLHPVALVGITGGYNSHKSSKGIFAVSTDGGSTLGNIVELSGVAASVFSRIRLTVITGENKYGLDIYRTNDYTSSGGFFPIRYGIATICSNIDIPSTDTAVDNAPSGETVIADLTIKTTTTGTVNTTA